MVISAIILFRSLKTQLRSLMLLPTLQEYQHFSTELTNKEKRNVSFTITLKTQTNSNSHNNKQRTLPRLSSLLNTGQFCNIIQFVLFHFKLFSKFYFTQFLSFEGIFSFFLNICIHDNLALGLTTKLVLSLKPTS